MWSHDIYCRLVTEEHGFLGQVAYSIYKDEKIRWCKRQHELNGKYPTKEELDQFYIQFAQTDEQLQRYLSMADEQLQQFLDLTLAEELEQHKLAVKDDAIVKAVKRNPLWTILEGVFAGVVASLLVMGLTVFFWFYSQASSGQELSAVVEKAGQEFPAMAPLIREASEDDN